MRYLSLFLLIFTLICNGQQNNLQVIDTVFYNFYGGPNQEEARDFIETVDKGFLICGSSSSFGQGASSVYLIKTDSNGVFKWGRTYGGINADRGMSVLKTSDNGAIVSGYSNSFNNFEYDVFYFKIDSAGNQVWQKTFNENDWEFAYSSALLPNDEIIIAGETYSQTNGGSDALLIKTNSIGETQWIKKIGFLQNDAFRSVCNLNGFIYAAGYYTESSTLLTKGLIAKFNHEGSLIDTFLLPALNSMNYKLNSIQVFDNASLIISGEIVKNETILPQSEFRMKIDTSLSVIWRDSAQFSEIKKGEYIFKHRLNNHLMSVFTLNGGNGKTAMFLADYTDHFYYNFGSTYGGLEEEQGVKGLLSSRNKLVYLGNTKTWGYGDQDFWMVMFKADTLISDHKTKNRFYTDTLSLSPIGLNELNDSGQVLVYPNPTKKNDLININLINKNSTIIIYDAFGRKVYEKTTQTERKLIIDPDSYGMSSGIYLVKISGNEYSTCIKLLVE